MEARIQAGEAKRENPKTEEKRFLRPAEAADASFLLALRNDPLVRKWSFHHDWRIIRGGLQRSLQMTIAISTF